MPILLVALLIEGFCLIYGLADMGYVSFLVVHFSAFLVIRIFD